MSDHTVKAVSQMSVTYHRTLGTVELIRKCFIMILNQAAVRYFTTVDAVAMETDLKLLMNANILAENHLVHLRMFAICSPK